jgi:hypothetical protein
MRQSLIVLKAVLVALLLVTRPQPAGAAGRRYHQVGPAYKFRTVYELIFEACRVLEEHERSQKMVVLREMLSAGSLEPGDEASTDEIEQWIKGCFSLVYEEFDE